MTIVFSQHGYSHRKSMTRVASQADLFKENEKQTLPPIPGLTYIPNTLCTSQEAALIATIDAQPWLNDLKRRVQHYGWRYDYQARTIQSDMYLGNLPQWLAPYCTQLANHGHFHTKPDQVIVNEYLPGQGISAHIDCVSCFDDTIASLSLGSHCIMEFLNKNETHTLLLERGSLLILSGDARYHWKHAIPARQSDRQDGVRTKRERRLSLTFRNVITPSQ